jgi:microcystin-dependent protein
MAISTHQGFPNVSAPLVNDKGYIQQSWLQLLISLWTRTGSGQGGSIFSAGDIKESAADGDQIGWFECDGRAISRTDYPNLFAAISTTYGSGDGSTTFNIPDYRGRFRIGTDTTYPLGSTGGASSVALSVGNLPSHTHSVTDPHHTHTFTGVPHTHSITDPGHHHTGTTVDVTNTAGAVSGSAAAGNTGNSTTGITVNSTTAGGTNSSAATGITIGSTGSGSPVSILPKYAPVTILIKT